MSKMNGKNETKHNIRLAGLGGQGVVTAAHVLGTAAVAAGKLAVVNPFFGAEKRLAPTESYVRIADEKIFDRGEILYPDVIMVFAPQVITLGKSHTIPFWSGLAQGGCVIINSDEPIVPQRDADELAALGARVAYVPATKLALEFAGTELATNMTMLGAFCGMASAQGEIVSLDDVLAAAAERLSGKSKVIASGTSAALDDALKSKYAKSGEMLERNMTAIKKAFEFGKI